MKLLRRIIYQTILTLLGINALVGAHSHSFFVPRSVTTDSVFELSLVNYHRYHVENSSCFQCYIKPFFMGSTRGEKLARYFLPNNKKCISLDESGHGDVDPLWINLISPIGTSYTSTVSIRPHRKVEGFLLTGYVDFFQCWWFGINTAFMHVKHDMELKETNRAQNGTIPGFSNAYEAFNNPQWTAGRLSCHTLTLNGFDDVQFKLGYDFYKTLDNHATLYAVGTAPTGKKPHALYVFEPIIGSKQGSFGVGFDGEYNLFSCDEQHVMSIMADIKFRYVFSATERRSFDLCKNGDWSRYLLVVTPSEPLNSLPGINLFTLPSKVTGRSTIDLWCALHYQHCAYNIEIGYDFWWRQAEKICRKCSIPDTFGIQTLALCAANITSASTANISQAAVGNNATISDAVFTFLTLILMYHRELSPIRIATNYIQILGIR